MRFFFSVVLFLAAVKLSAQSMNADDELLKKKIGGLFYAGTMLFADGFTPFTEYDHDEKIISGTIGGAYIDNFMDKNSAETDSGKGISASLDAAYAFTNDLEFFTSLSALNLSGKMSSKVFNESNEAVSENINFTSVSVFGGIGVDNINNAFISIPIFFGIYGQYSIIDLNAEKFTYYDTDLTSNTSLQVQLEDSLFAYGFAGGAALSIQIFRQVLIVPHYIYMYNMNNADFKTESKYAPDSGSAFRTEKILNTGNISTGVIGLDLTYRFNRNFSATLSAGSIISSYFEYYNNLMLNGTRVMNLSLTVSYRN